MEEESSREGLVQLVRAIEAEGKIREKIRRPSIDRFFLLYDALALRSRKEKKNKRNLIRRFPFNFFCENKNKQEIEFIPFNSQKGEKKEIL